MHVRITSPSFLQPHLPWHSIPFPAEEEILKKREIFSTLFLLVAKTILNLLTLVELS